MVYVNAAAWLTAHEAIVDIGLITHTLKEGTAMLKSTLALNAIIMASETFPGQPQKRGNKSAASWLEHDCLY